MTEASAAATHAEVALLTDVGMDAAEALVRSYRARLAVVPRGAAIPGSYWGAPEAGLLRDTVYVRGDTPVHSVLHELAHFACMDERRREKLATDARGDDEEECAVCYLQVLLADRIPGYGRARCFDDMDAWGYSFREGSARAWFAGDGAAAAAWLTRHGLTDSRVQPTSALRR